MDLKQWCRNQAEEAKRYKWLKGVELGKDPGEKAIIDWVNNYAGLYRKEYKECYDDILNKVTKSIKDKTSEIDEEKLHCLTQLIIEEFIKLWIKECAIENKHIEEI